MDTTQVMATVMSSLLSLAGLWIFIQFFYPRIVVDYFRQSMFVLRDRLFDDAAAGLVPFDHPAYQILRTTMNGFIRFAHRMNLLQLVLFMTFAGRTSIQPGREGRSDYQARWNDAIRGLDDRTQSRLKTYRTEMSYMVAKHIMLNSPIFMLTVIVPLVSFLLLKKFLRSMLNRPNNSVDRLNSFALAMGR